MYPSIIPWVISRPVPVSQVLKEMVTCSCGRTPDVANNKNNVKKRGAILFVDIRKFLFKNKSMYWGFLPSENNVTRDTISSLA
jgi:hypothetical protein